MFGFSAASWEDGAPNPNKLLLAPGTRTPNPEPRTRNPKPEPEHIPNQGAGCPKPEQVMPAGQRAALIQPEQFNASKCCGHKKTPARGGGS